MHVDAAQRRDVKHLLRKNAPVGGNDDQLRLQCLKIGKCRAVTHFDGLKNGDPMFDRAFLYGRRCDPAAVSGLVRLRKNAAKRMPVRDQPLENCAGKFRRTHKDDPHSSSSFSFSRIYCSNSSSVRTLQCSV